MGLISKEIIILSVQLLVKPITVPRIFNWIYRSEVLQALIPLLILFIVFEVTLLHQKTAKDKRSLFML